jgi:ribosomal protein L11 methyltransferase
MVWFQLSMEISGDRVDATVAALEALGSQATTQQNAGEDSYFDLAYPLEPKWDLQQITGLFEDSGNAEYVLAQLMAKLAFVRDVELSNLEEQDWEKAWLENYQPIEITPQLWVYPNWVTPKQSLETIIKIDPGMAFGTGTHETTRLCMQILSRMELSGRTVLDYGCGSGILAITALKLGASRATGVDIDPRAETVSQENALNNGVARDFAIQSTSNIEGLSFDIVVANILSFALIELTSTLVGHTRENGMIILSGILANQADEVTRAYQSVFAFERHEESGWVALLGRYKHR